jgi:glycosyltransferase involved in cell wall biosynthesis
MKISVIMQTYLGDYPGARTHAREKFVRAINSFTSQTWHDKELIIVADGCAFAKRIYELIYTSNAQIKFVWIDPEQKKKTYEKADGKTFFRGYPKSIGLKHATGDIVCYLDSDDIILPNYLYSLQAHWQDIPEKIKWATNSLRIMNLKLLGMEKAKEHKAVYSNQSVDLSTYGIHDDFFINICVPPGQINCATCNLSHRRNIDTTWEDSVGVNEDVSLIKRIQEKHGGGVRLAIPGYVVCHYVNGWDC